MEAPSAIWPTRSSRALRDAPMRRSRIARCCSAPRRSTRRSSAQVMARDLGPQGVHVAYVNVDGAIDMPFIHKLRPDLKQEDMLSPAAIAESFWHVAHQDRSAWTQELDVRPFGEKF